MLTIVTPSAESDLVTVSRVKTELNISGSAEDPKLKTFIIEASALIAAYCGRDTFGSETLLQTERLCEPTSCIVLARDLGVSITSVAVDGEALTTDEYELDGSLLYRLSDDTRIAWRPAKVEIAYTAGYALTSGAPLALSRAALDLVVAMYRGAGRDSGIRQEMVEGVGSTSYFDTSAGKVPLSADRTTALERYRLVGFG